MNTNNKITLSKLTFLRKPYRVLLENELSCAVPSEKCGNHIVEQLEGRYPILDPMAGYGSLLSLCSKRGIPSVSIETNVPRYLWQLIKNPNLSQIFIRIIDRLLDEENSWPKVRRRADVSNSWFLIEALDIVRRLIKSISLSLIERDVSFEIKPEIIAAAVIVPFCGRLSCCTESENNPAWIKKGGIVVYMDWESDFKKYLNALKVHLVEIADRSIRGVEHKVILGDCRKIRFKNVRFHSFFTSPSYLDRLDHYKMFGPEIAFCNALGIREIKPFLSTDYIGSTLVRRTSIERFSSKVVSNFLEYIRSSCPNKSRKNYNKIYCSYYANYFYSLFEAYKNISQFLHSDFVGFIIAQNNHFRNTEVPVAQAIVEMWKSFGFRGRIIDRKEIFYFEALNLRIRARGIKAKQLGFIIKVTR